MMKSAVKIGARLGRIGASEESVLTLQGISCAAVGELAATNTIVLHELTQEQASLEEAFMRLTLNSVEYHAASTSDETAVGAAR